MSRIPPDSGLNRPADAPDGRPEPPGKVATLLGAALGLLPARRNSTALAMMSERELDDLGLLPWEIQSEIDGGADDRAAIRRVRTPVAIRA